MNIGAVVYFNVFVGQPSPLSRSAPTSQGQAVKLSLLTLESRVGLVGVAQSWFCSAGTWFVGPRCCGPVYCVPFLIVEWEGKFCSISEGKKENGFSNLLASRTKF